MLNRRTFLKSGAALPLASSLSGALPAAPPLDAETVVAAGALVPLPARLAPEDPAQQHWVHRIRRVAQSNMTEHDPAVMNIDEWADYWHGARADIVFVSVTGILAFYPSKVPFHRHGKFLNNRDFFGECVAAARKRGMRVVARMSPDLNWPDALAAHPEWAMRNRDGSPQTNADDAELFKTCMFSSYMDDYVPAIMHEINSLYDVDCFYTNGWPQIGALPECHCAVCSKLPSPNTNAYWQAYTERVLQLWQRYDGIAKEKKADSFFFANLGGTVRGGPNLDRLGRVAQWFQADNQGRTSADPAIWGCSLQGRVCNAIMDGKFATNVTAAYSTGSVVWRNASKNPAEARMWMAETSASGMVPYYHFVGSEAGLGEDRRWHKTGEDYFRWTAEHDAHLQGRRSIANIGVVFGQGTQLLYPGPSGGRDRAYMHETTQGLYEVLLRGRFAFDFVHEDRLLPEQLKKYRALLLPNIAMLSDEQCGHIRNFVGAGGSLMASFQTSLYDGDLKRRDDFGLADVLGVRRFGDVIGTVGNAYYGRIERQHPILDGFADTNWIAGAQNRQPVQTLGDPVLSVVPGFVRYPPELAYPPVAHTKESAVVLRESGASRIAYFPGDVERTYWLTGHGDLLRLLTNTLRWVTHEERIVDVAGDGFVEVFAWETAPGYAVHILNYTNPNAHHDWLEQTYPLGPQAVRMKLPAGVRVKSVELLRGGGAVQFTAAGEELRFTIPRVEDYEVAAVTVA